MSECNNDTPDYIVVPSTGVGTIPGPAGPAGPQGPPGSTEGITASEVAVTNVGYSNVQEVLDALLYVLITVTKFLANTTVYEIGADFAQLGFTWTYNKTPIVSQIITGPNESIALGISERAATLDFVPNLGSDHQSTEFVETETFTILVDDGTTSGVTRNETVSFYSGVYFGDAENAAIDSNFIKALSAPRLQSGRGTSFSSVAGVDEFAWFAHKKSLGQATFTVGGNPGGFEAPTELSFLNASGHTELYYVYRSTNSNIGPITVVVS